MASQNAVLAALTRGFDSTGKTMASQNAVLAGLTHKVHDTAEVARSIM